MITLLSDMFGLGRGTIGRGSGEAGLLDVEDLARGDASLELLHGQLDGFDVLVRGGLQLLLLLAGEVDADDFLVVGHVLSEMRWRAGVTYGGEAAGRS